MRTEIHRLLSVFITAFFAILLNACRKLVSVPPPDNTLTTTQVFATDQQATSAMTGVYFGMINTSPAQIFNGGATMECGTSADEFLFFYQGAESTEQFQNNDLLSNNGLINASFWQPVYTTIYGCNSVLSGVTASNGIHDSVRNELIGEAEFVRAFANFYLINLFGPVPLVTTTNYTKTALLPNSSPDSLYASILTDLKDAQQRLPADYSVGNGQRIIPNKWAATALLARVYLYTKDWADAATQASLIIGNSSQYNLTSLDSVFLINSNEAIWQLQQNIQGPPYNATQEGVQIIPNTPSDQPYLYLTPVLLGAFENSDNRRSIWVDSTFYQGQFWYYPYKYQIGPAQSAPNVPYTEYYMVLRLGEQFLIRAEAEANGAGGGLPAAIADLNAIRIRAGLSGYAGPTQLDSVMTAIIHERQIELFGEWGHRWLDLKRWGIAPAILTADKPNPVTETSLLFPIPFEELQADPNLKQNPGYN